MPPSATTKKPRTRERIVRHAVVIYETKLRRPDGTAVTVSKTAERGDLVVLDAVEEAKLDALGALGADGETLEQIEAAISEQQDLFRQSRQNAAGPGEAF
jgi:hypothetical protein